MRILLVEDEEKVSRFIIRGLAAEGFAVDAAADGPSGLELATTYNYDLIVLDLMLPGLSGTEVLRQIRGSDHRVPILMLTARDAVADKVEHLEAGADDYLTKPFEPEELLLRLRALLRRSTGVTQIVVEVGHLSLDTATGAIACGGKQLSLTHLETQVLTHFIHHADAVVSRTQISEAVYELERDVNFNTLEVIVSRLRKKIGHDSIETVRGGGYRLRGQKITNALD